MRTPLLCLALTIFVEDVQAQGSPGALEVGSRAIMHVPSDPSLEPSGPFTIELWMKARGRISHGRLVRKAADYDAGYILSFAFQGTTLRGEIVEPGPRVSSVDDPSPNAIYLGGWHHVAWSANPGRYQRLYVDGQRVAEALCPPILSHTGEFTVGGSAFIRTGIREEFIGLIDELRFWGVERTAVEIAENRFRRISSQSGLVSAWHFDGDFLDSAGSNHGEAWGGSIVPSDAPVARFFQLSESSGTWQGGQAVELRGSFPVPGPPAEVRFGSAPSTSVRVLDPERLEVVVPPGAAGSEVEVEVDYPGFTMSGTSLYTYLPWLSVPGGVSIGTTIPLRVELPPPGQLLLFAGAPPAIRLAIPPFAGELGVLPPVLVLLSAAAHFDAVEVRLRVPRDPALIGAELLIQGFFVHVGGNGTFTNPSSLEVIS